jgi:hypothetical protein
MAKHRTFNADRFIDKFQGNEGILNGFVRLWKDELGLDSSSLDIPGFKEWLVNGEGDAKGELLEALYQVYDLCTDQGHEDLLSACAEFSYEPDPSNSLPVECLSLKVRTENDEAFTLAYDRLRFEQAERFTIYKGSEPRPVTDLTTARNTFQRRLAEEFKNHKNSDRVLVRCYEEGSYVNFIVYHEKRMKATLVLKGPAGRLKVRPNIFRPAQQDFISYNRDTGRVEIEAGFENEETRLRRCFAECCLGDADFFEGEEAATQIDLKEIARPEFLLDTSEESGITAVLIELKFSLAQKQSPRFYLCSRDLLKTLELNGLREKLEGKSIAKAVLKITFPDDQRGKRIELSGPNKIKFKRATHAKEVFDLLKEWGLLVGEEEDGDIAELRAASTEFAGVPASAATGNSAVSKTGTTVSRAKPSPR